MDGMTGSVLIVGIIALGLPTVLYTLGWIDRAVKMMLKRGDRQIPSAQVEALVAATRELKERVAMLEADRDSQFSALQEQVDFMERLLSEGSTVQALPPDVGSEPGA